MTLHEIIREQAREILDALTFVDSRLKSAISGQAAAEDRIKRAATEITRYRTQEIERKRLFVETSDRFKEIQEKLDDLERQRQEIVERWNEKREEKEQAEKLLSESRSATERALDVHRSETEKRDREIESLSSIEVEKSQFEGRLREAHRRSVGVYMLELERRIEQAFAGEEELNRRRQSAAEFMKARHEDQQIGDLCDQRDQYRELISRATVPVVERTLRRELESVEQELDRRYPGALSINENLSSTALFEEIYFLTGPDGFLRIVLPISEKVWDGISRGEAGTEAACAMRIAWEMIKSIGLKPRDGEFCFSNGYCMFVSRDLSADDMMTIGEFVVKLRNSATVTFRCSPFPTQVQEALYETIHG